MWCLVRKNNRAHACTAPQGPLCSKHSDTSSTYAIHHGYITSEQQASCIASLYHSDPAEMPVHSWPARDMPLIEGTLLRLANRAGALGRPHFSPRYARGGGGAAARPMTRRGVPHDAACARRRRRRDCIKGDRIVSNALRR